LRVWEAKITPRLAKALTVAIVRRAHKNYPQSGAVGYYGFESRMYSTKAELREAVLEFCEALTWDQVQTVQRNFNLL